MNKFRNVKFRVSGAEQVRAALTELFADGCVWGGSNPRDLDAHNNATHLFVNQNGRISYIDDNDERFFLSQAPFKLITPEFKTEVTTTVTMVLERPKTLLFGKMYYSDDLKAALATLEVAE